ncbi:MAG: DUF378 domain-containing protein [Alphaproteobacteria bacterium]|jgi:uncharacterized membrane protein YuzA (DUF378 family)|nr:DUF378 domain-containing protein [Alphaproteobacteria bacterium]MBR2922726.1 DUF378 domain-containing protein [Alphaproteobacteria bacterium]
MSNWMRTTALVLTIIGGINWGLVGLFSFDLVAFIFGPMSILSRIVYTLVALSAITLAFAPSCSLKESVQHKMN